MHPIWQIPELLVHVVSFLSANEVSCCFRVSHHFRTSLKVNLPPQLRPLPDSPCLKKSSNAQTLFQDVRDKAKAYTTQEAATPKQLKVEKAYHYWREDAQQQVLHALSPHLHSLLGKHTTCLLDGYESLAAGKISTCFRTEMPYHDFYDLVHGKERQDHDDLLAVVPPEAVTVFCLNWGWDLLYANVKYRDYGGMKLFSVRVERKGGVRLSDVLDELRGTLVMDGMSGGLEQDVVLVWVCDDCSEG